MSKCNVFVFLGALLCAGCVTMNPSFAPDAVAKYKEKADAGDAEAQYLYAVALANGKGVKEDTAGAFGYAQKSATQGFAQAFRIVGLGYQKGWGGLSNNVEAAKWFDKFIQWAKPEAERGNVWAQYNLGKAYRHGQGVAANYEEAVKWYRKAAEQGHAESQGRLGECYARGMGVGTNFTEAVKWYRRAAEQGHAKAQNWLGWCYKNGKGVKIDLAESARWYRKAAGSSLQARRLQCKREAEDVAEKRREEQSAKVSERQAQAEREKRQRDVEKEGQRQRLLAIQAELKKVREAKARAEAR